MNNYSEKWWESKATKFKMAGGSSLHVEFKPTYDKLVSLEAKIETYEKLQQTEAIKIDGDFRFIIDVYLGFALTEYQDLAKQLELI